MKDNKKIIISIFCVLSVLLITIGVTYSVFTYTKKGDTQNIIKAGKITFLYTENTGTGTGINITNAFPVSDTLGKAYTADEQVFDFKVESEIVGNATIPYEVTVGKTNSSTLPENIVKLYLTDTTDAEEVELVAPTRYNKLPFGVTNPEEKQIYFDTVDANEDYLKKFRLRMWIADTTLEGEATNQEDINGKSFTVKVNVYSQEEVFNNNTVVYVSAIDSNGTNLNAKASVIEDEQKQTLLSDLVTSGYISEINDVSAIIEVESDDFNNIAITTFNVSNIAAAGDKIVVFHFNETTNDWEYVCTQVVDENGYITNEFTSFSPVAFSVIKNDDYSKLDSKTPDITPKTSQLGINDQDYDFTNNIDVTFGYLGGEVLCDPPASLKTGSYSVTCEAKGKNGLSSSTTFEVKHSYPATATMKSCATSACGQAESCSDSTCWGCRDYGPNNTCNDYYQYGCKSCNKYNKTCQNPACGYNYSCPNGGHVEGTICVY